MATTSNTYTGNGTNKLFSITFPYLDTSDIDVYLNGVLQTITTQYFFANATTIEFVAAPSNGAVVLLNRSTDDTTLQATFFPGSSIKAADLNDNFDQVLYLSQETNNNVANAVAGQIPDGSITVVKIADNSITSAKIVNDSIINEDVNSAAGIVASKLSFTQSGTGATARTVDSKLKDTVSVKDFGAVGDGVADDTVAIQAALNSNFGCIFFPEGTYKITSTVTASTDKRITGARQVSSTITLHTSTPGTVAIKAEATRVQFDSISIISNSGINDGLATVGFYHSRPGGGTSVGRITHRDFTMSGFSEAAIIVDQAISYGICDGTIACGKYGILIRPHITTGTISTSVTLQNLYIFGGKTANIALFNVSDTTLIKCVLENGGSAAVADSAALFNSLGRVRCFGCYFEANYRNISTNSAIIEIGSFDGTEDAPSIYTFTPATAFASRGNVLITQNRITTRFLSADTSYTNYLEVESPIVSTSDIASSSGNIRSGSTSSVGRTDNVTLGLKASVNANAAGFRDTIGSVVDLGVSYSAASATGRWMRIKQCMNGNTDHRLDFIRMTGDYYNPTDGTESILFRLYSTSIRPGADGTIALGSASTRYSEVFASAGTINTSDERAKQDISGLDDAEKAVAVTLKGLIKKYRFKDAVQRKGDAARIHVGVIAQDVVAAFAAQGLDATRYGLLCYDEWHELDGEEVTADESGTYPDGSIRRDRYGIRYEELLAFIVSAL